jgi:hypothetical protein
LGDEILVPLSGEHITDPIWCVFGSRMDQVENRQVSAGSYAATIHWPHYNLIEWMQ